MDKEKYCILENDGIALCVCKHRPCEQLKRKEQECEELKNKLLCESVKGRYVYSLTSQPEINRIGYLERENKKLVNDLNKFGNLNNKYKQALQEIREYCEEQNLKADYTACEVIRRIEEVIGVE